MPRAQLKLEMVTRVTTLVMPLSSPLELDGPGSALTRSLVNIKIQSHDPDSRVSSSSESREDDWEEKAFYREVKEPD